MDAERRELARAIVQVGTQQRSGRHYQRARTSCVAARSATCAASEIGAFRNILPGFTQPVGSRSPPRSGTCGSARRPRCRSIRARCLYHFRWFNDYSGGQTTNLLAHEIDIVQWVTGAVPVRVAAFAQRKSLTGFGETPDVFDAIFEYPDVPGELVEPRDFCGRHAATA